MVSLLLALIAYGYISYNISVLTKKQYHSAAGHLNIPTNSASIAYGQHLQLSKDTPNAMAPTLPAAPCQTTFPWADYLFPS